MPADLKQNHHLLFTLYHVSCQKKPQEVQTSVETPVGYSVSLLPLPPPYHSNGINSFLRIEIRSLNDCNMLVEELKKRLAKLGIETAAGVNRTVWSEHQKTIVLKLIMGGAFYPNIFLRSSPECQKYDNEVIKMLNGRNSYTIQRSTIKASTNDTFGKCIRRRSNISSALSSIRRHAQCRGVVWQPK